MLKDHRDAVGAILARHVSEKPPEKLLDAIAELIESAVGRERERCAAVCRERAALWRRTPSASADLPSAREEARARANEASYLADLLELTLDGKTDDPSVN